VLELDRGAKRGCAEYNIYGNVFFACYIQVGSVEKSRDSRKIGALSRVKKVASRTAIQWKTWGEKGKKHHMKTETWLKILANLPYEGNGLVGFVAQTSLHGQESPMKGVEKKTEGEPDGVNRKIPRRWVEQHLAVSGVHRGMSGGGGLRLLNWGGERKGDTNETKK